MTKGGGDGVNMKREKKAHDPKKEATMKIEKAEFKEVLEA